MCASYKLCARVHSLTYSYHSVSGRGTEFLAFEMLLCGDLVGICKRVACTNTVHLGGCMVTTTVGLLVGVGMYNTRIHSILQPRTQLHTANKWTLRSWRQTEVWSWTWSSCNFCWSCGWYSVCNSKMVWNHNYHTLFIIASAHAVSRWSPGKCAKCNRNTCNKQLGRQSRRSLSNTNSNNNNHHQRATTHHHNLVALQNKYQPQSL